MTLKGFTGPILKFDAMSYTSGTTWLDTINSTPATLVGDVTLTTGPNALNFTATGGAEEGYAQVTPGIYFNHSFTIEGWVYVNSYANWSRLIDFGNFHTDNIILAVNNGGIQGHPIFEFNGGYDGQVLSSSQIPLGEWVHLSATYNYTSRTGTLYMNGIQVGQSTSSSQLTQNVNRNQCYIGKSNWGADDNLEGAVGELAIYPFAMSGTEVLAQYNTRKTHYGL
jgi:hypothetical protein